MNTLYPIFIKLHELQLLIVGAGEVGHEKLSFILKNSPDANITMVAPDVNPKIYEVLEKHPNHKVNIIQRKFHDGDVQFHDLIIAATDIKDLNKNVRLAAKAQGKLVNVADTPMLCDFYLGAIVTRGDLKVAISTNGKSPTFAKRFRQMLEEILPDDTNELLHNLKKIRDNIQGNFTEKVKKLNKITAELISK